MTRTPAAQAVITGIGWVGPFGAGDSRLLAEVLQANVSAIQPRAGYATTGLASCLAAEIPSACLPLTEEARRWSRSSQMTVLACRHAVAEAALTETTALTQAGLVVGSQYGDLRSTEAFCLGFLRKGPLGLSPLLFPSTVMNAMAGTTSIALGLQGPMLTVNQDSVAGELAVARALLLLRAGRAATVIVCGVDELVPLLYDTLAQLHVLSPRQQGDEACRPFDQRHNGPVLGEAATALVLESPAHAQARGAPILATISGACWGGSPTRPGHVPSLEVASDRIVTRVLDEAAVPPTAIDMAYLSGYGDPQHDTVELACVARAFGAARPLVTAVTHLTGQSGGLGALRVAAAAVTLQQGISPVLDYLQQPIRTDIRFVTQPVSARPRHILVHGLALGGVQTAILLSPASHVDATAM